MESIAIPEKLTHIWQSAFYGCEGLKIVYYDGDETLWNQIESMNEEEEEIV